MESVWVALSGLWLMLPSLLPNSAAVIFGGGTPIDFGRSWRGKRIFGDGKTWSGLIGGVSAGVSFGIILLFIAYPFDPVNFWGFGDCPGNVGVIFVLSLGSLLGDLGGSFIKRRLGMERGAKAPVLDQYNFAVGSIVLTSIFFPDWFVRNFVEGEHILALIVFLIAIPILHRAVNIIGYKTGKKDVPW
jgi:CDP-2,3-bis-(O-geranylgeranyl)-sn-glycerol synthase